MFDARACKALLLERLAEPAPGRIQLLAGPRQVGKTTLLLDLVETLGTAGLYWSADSSEASLPGAWERLWSDAESRAKSGRVVVLIDEAPYASGWAQRTKSAWDRIRRHKLPIHIVLTGSSALQLGRGSKESLAGRFERIVLAHWSARSLASAFDLEPAQAARYAVERGTYPGAFEYRGDPSRWLAYVRDAIAEPAIGRDLLAFEAVRKPALLRQVFYAAVMSPAQIVSLHKLQGRLQESSALETLAHYLELLENAFLVAAVEKFAARGPRQRAAPPKLVTLNQSLLALGGEATPSATSDPARFGAWLENAVLAHAWNSGQTLRYWREEPLEVDAVIEGSWGAWAIEVKSGRVDARGLAGLAEFTRRHTRFQPLVVCDEGSVADAERFGFRAQHWEDFLLDGPPHAAR